MTELPAIPTSTSKLAIAIGTAAAVASAVSWILLVLLSGSVIPRAILVSAALAVTLAVCAYRAARAGQIWVLILATSFGSITPPVIGNAPEEFRYVGFLALGYAIAAALWLADWKSRRRVS